MVWCASARALHDNAPGTARCHARYKVASRAVRWFVAALECAPAAYAQHLPLTTYTTAQGLADNEVFAAVEDTNMIRR
jgi:hypothetical protein